MNKKFLIVFSLLMIVMAVGMVFYLLGRKVPMDTSDSGNLAGNLQNEGLFFELDGKVYFSNSADSGCLYSMNVDESNQKRLTSMNTKYISGAHNYLYFYMDSTKTAKNVSGLGAASNQFGLYRCQTDGRRQTCVLRDFCGQVQLCGEYLYYQLKTNSGSLNKIRVDKKNNTKVADELISPVCYDKGMIYYTGVNDDHRIHVLNTSTDRSNDFLSGNLFFPVAMDNYLYYLNGDSSYSLWRANLLTGEVQLLTSERIDCFTMDHQYIYYSVSSATSPALKRCDLDGSNQYILYSGVTNSLNLTSRYLYFRVFGDDTTTYHIPVNGSAGASVFVAQ